MRALLLAGLGIALAACQPKIGDSCRNSQDCSFRGDRVCDTSQPLGYCTVFGCLGHAEGKLDSPGACPASATCVAIHPGIPGCGYDDRRAPARSTRTLCAAKCERESDCRAGYTCAFISDAPWRGRPLDDGPISKVCIPEPTSAISVMDDADAAVCSPNPPPSPDAGRDAGTDAPTSDASDAGADADDAGASADAQDD